jgi:recombination protein RecR
MDDLVQRLSRLPGIGKRSAERIAFYLLKQPAQEAMELARAIADLKNRTRHCSTCFNLTDADPCSICVDSKRDQSLVLVVEQPGDLVRFESTGLHKGVYHVLMGRLAPLDGVGPGDINVASLVQRVESGVVREVILGMNPTFEGDGTSLYLADRLSKLGVKVTRLARGLPTGANLEVASKAVLADALAGRQKME